MKILVEIAEVLDRFEELFELVARGDHVLFCRDGTPVVEMNQVPKGAEMGDKLWAMMDAERVNVPAGITSNHDDFYDEHGLPK